MTLQKLQEEYFEKLSDELERLYPKGISKERSTALAFNSFANMFARESIQCAYEAGRDDERRRCADIARKSVGCGHFTCGAAEAIAVKIEGGTV